MLQTSRHTPPCPGQHSTAVLDQASGDHQILVHVHGGSAVGGLADHIHLRVGQRRPEAPRRVDVLDPRPRLDDVGDDEDVHIPHVLLTLIVCMHHVCVPMRSHALPCVLMTNEFHLAPPFFSF